MSRRVAFSVPGEPKGKGRPRAVPRIVWKDDEPEAVVSLITPPDTKEAEARVRDAFRRAHPKHKPFTGPVLLRFTAVFETPKSFNRALREAAARGKLYAMKKPDKDNIEKLIVDALNRIAFIDDQQVMGGGIKRYGTPARLEISFEPLDSPDVPATPGQKRNEARPQPELPLQPRKARPATPTKAEKPPPDLSGWSPRQRALIEAALARDEAARKGRG
jgi:Holliday junction resolvase RusA-like endonuclease